VDWDEALRWADGIRSRSETVVFTNGCFDLIHPGHVHLLERAASLGDRLIIGLNSDASVQRLKGRGRPLLDEEARAGLLLAMRWVDRVVLFDEDTPLRLIRHIRPQVLVKGGDYRPETVVGAADVREWGGDVVIIPLLSGFSTTALTEKLRRPPSL
jgi:D-beta-D-heptose 7-phosphate kinase/D-beta-D-heptose 1-phosphate adenosyltransferase